MVFGHKHRSLKGKLAMPFHRTPKTSVPAAPPAASHGLAVENGEFVLPSSKLKASTLMKNGVGDLSGYVDGAKDGDSINEVDRMAANYISYVLERFKRERLDDDWRKY